MKKALILILSFIYLTSSVGATVHMHYCMDKLVSWSLESNTDKACEYCGMLNKETKGDDKGCCKEEQKQVKLESDQKVTPFGLTYHQLAFTVVPTLFYLDYSPTWSTALQLIPESHAPPRIADIAVYLRHCTFRI